LAGFASIVVRHDRLAALGAAILAKAGSSPREARIVAEHLVEANLKGHDSHGIGMMPIYIENVLKGLLRLNRKARIVRDKGAVLVVDGELGCGQVVAMQATELGIARAKRHGIALVALRNAHHIGRVGTYGERCLADGLVSMHFVNVARRVALVAPFGGREARFGTNPLCFTMPGAKGEDPIVLDMATSIVAVGKIRVAKNRGKRVPEGYLVDAKGRMTTDPNAMYANPPGALMPFGTYKGYGLALIAELFAGALTGGGTLAPKNKITGSIVNNMLMVILDPKRLGDAKAIAAERRAALAWVKSAKRAIGGTGVLVAGDPERRARAKRLKSGIPVERATWLELLAAGRAVGLTDGAMRKIAGVGPSV
jgi:uncharacterized oxidoreductase